MYNNKYQILPPYRPCLLVIYCPILFLVILLAPKIFAQELNFNVQVQLSPSLPTADNAIYQDMEETIRQFLNSTKWTDDEFSDNELIECNLVVLIKERPDVNSFVAEMNLQLARPVLNSSYNTLVANFSQNYSDSNFSFEYVTSQSLNFAENQYESELSATLIFYALTLIGLDYDSFSNLGGTSFHERARKIVFQAEQLELPGWTQNVRPPRNRYWLNENLTTKQLQPVREAIYEYHRLGLDLMHKDEKQARINILKALKKVKKAYDARNDAYIITIFLHAKSDELVKIFSKGDLTIRRQVYNLLVQMLPTKQTQFIQIIR